MHPKIYLSFPDSLHPRLNHHSAQGAIFSWLVHRFRLWVLFFSLTEKKHPQNAPGIGFGMTSSSVTRPRHRRYRLDLMHLLMTWAVISTLILVLPAFFALHYVAVGALQYTAD